MFFNKGGKLSDLEKRISAARADLAAAELIVETTAAAEEAAIETAASYAKWRSDCEVAAIEVGRLKKLIAGLEPIFDERRRSEQLDAVRKRASAARKANAALAARVRVEGPKLSSQIIALIAEVAAASVEAAEINTLLPDGDEPVVDAEVLARGQGFVPREIISESIESLWVYEETGNLVGDQDSVVANDGRGVLQTHDNKGRKNCVRRKFKVIKFHPSADRVRTGPLFSEINLPYFDQGGSMTTNRWRLSAADFVKEAATAARPPAAPEPREVQTEMTPLEPWIPSSTSATRRYHPDRNVTVSM